MNPFLKDSSPPTLGIETEYCSRRLTRLVWIKSCAVSYGRSQTLLFRLTDIFHNTFYDASYCISTLRIQLLTTCQTEPLFTTSSHNFLHDVLSSKYSHFYVRHSGKLITVTPHNHAARLYGGHYVKQSTHTDLHIHYTHRHTPILLSNAYLPASSH